MNKVDIGYFKFAHAGRWLIQFKHHKKYNFDLATTKDKSLQKLLVQKTSQCLDFSYKRQGAIW